MIEINIDRVDSGSIPIITSATGRKVIPGYAVTYGYPDIEAGFAGFGSDDSKTYQNRARRVNGSYTLEERHTQGPNEFNPYEPFGTTTRKKAINGRLLKRAREVAKSRLEELSRVLTIEIDDRTKEEGGGRR